MPFCLYLQSQETPTGRLTGPAGEPRGLDEPVPQVDVVRPDSGLSAEMTGETLLLMSYLHRGYSRDIAEVMVSARRSSSDRQYAIYFRKYLQFCRDINVGPFATSVAEGLRFLQTLHVQGSSYSAINVARSALSLIREFQGVSFGTHPDVVQFMKGLANLKPSAPRYSHVWDLDVVLDLLKWWSPKEKLSLPVLTMKTVMLVLVVSGQRPQIISKLHVDRMDVSASQFTFRMLPSDFKQGTRGSYPEELVFRKFPGDKRICIYTYLAEYLKRTLDIRGKCKSLFLTVGTPHKEPSVATISRWIKSVLRNSGVNTHEFKPASVRTAVASKVALKGVSISSILKLGGWTRESTFTKYYKKPIRSNKLVSIQSSILS